MADFIARLKQRKLVQWALAYLAAAWVSLQVLSLAADSYDWPRGFMRSAFAVITLGFVIAPVLPSSCGTPSPVRLRRRAR